MYVLFSGARAGYEFTARSLGWVRHQKLERSGVTRFGHLRSLRASQVLSAVGMNVFPDNPCRNSLEHVGSVLMNSLNT